MNRAKLKSYAPQARRDFIRAVTDRARKVGLSALHIEPIQVQGDVALIGGQAFPKGVAAQRKRLDEQIQRNGFTAVMEEVAYTWFNRFMAIRYMEVHGYFEHGYRILSHPAGGARPEILEQAEHVDLPGLDRAKVIDLKLDGTKDEELYKTLLLAQCRSLHQAMPFLFERIDDATELLLPDGLLASDSLIRKMVGEIPEEDWQQIEVIGWLYQFYISEKKDEVIGKVVKSEDIPAATQLFTPNWIVKYMVQNSLGAKWLATYPNSPLKGKMEYYIEPAEQTEKVKAQLAAITPTSLDPETITLMDPACGSGHILVEAYDLFREIYLERGYRPRDIPRLILEKNLFGLDIDDRAAQMAGFAVLMKARAEDRRILQNVPHLNVLAIRSSAGLNSAEIADVLLTPHRVELVTSNELFPETRRQPPLTVEENLPCSRGDINALLGLYLQATTIGSLLTVPAEIIAKLPAVRDLLANSVRGSGLLGVKVIEDLTPILSQSVYLSSQYDVVVANPPYMTGGLNPEQKTFLSQAFPSSKSDLSATFIAAGLRMTKEHGFLAMVTMHSWMFVSSLEQMRLSLLEGAVIYSLAHHGIGAFKELNSKVVQTASFSIRKSQIANASGQFQDVREGNEEVKRDSLLHRTHKVFTVPQNRFARIPGSPLAFWVSDEALDAFSSSLPLHAVAEPKAGISTGANEKSILFWYEVPLTHIGFGLSRPSLNYRFYPHNKGGGFRRWYGNNLYVLKYGQADIRRMETYPGFRHDNSRLYFQPMVSWGKVTSALFSARFYPEGYTFDSAGISIFPKEVFALLSFLNSSTFFYLQQCLNQTLNFTVGDIGRIPVLRNIDSLPVTAEELVAISKENWNSFEISWDFHTMPLLQDEALKTSFDTWMKHTNEQWERLRTLEIGNNRMFIEAYGLQDELTSDVPEKQITLVRADRKQDMRRLISYALGCMMGRYSLDGPGLIYADSGNKCFDPARYATFPADDDGILPLTDTDWFGSDDTANRFAAFVRVAWPAETLNENLTFVAESLGPKAGETALDTIRRYLHTGFYKDHLQTYKNRPIYWLFTSGNERAFQALVYLHRYNAGTLSRMRTEYVTKLQTRISARIAYLEDNIPAATSTSARKELQKERDKFVRQQAELLHFDEKLRHYADQRIPLDLDDGVKVNYGKFGDLLADVKAITGDKDE